MEKIGKVEIMNKQQIVNELTLIISDVSNLYAKYGKDDIYKVALKLVELSDRIKGGNK